MCVYAVDQLHYHSFSLIVWSVCSIVYDVCMHVYMWYVSIKDHGHSSVYAFWHMYACIYVVCVNQRSWSLICMYMLFGSDEIKYQ